VTPSRFGLFEAFGVELEYMIADRGDLSVRPLAEVLLRDPEGRVTSDVERGGIAWSNELVSHVLEMKTNGPVPSLAGISAEFHRNVLDALEMLAADDALLLPTGAHPFMDPYTEMLIWPHEYNAVYSLYNRIFDCRGHGWANLQSTHLNLPFRDDGEFGVLHAAVRLVLPLVPALAASTPFLDGSFTGFLDARMEAYRLNQKAIPSIGGKVVPEAVFTQADYERRIFEPMLADIRPHDTEGVLERHFLNSRGAIARFDRGTIEIRVVDIQECPSADLAIIRLLVEVLRAMTEERWSGQEAQRDWSEDDLLPLLLGTIRSAEETIIGDTRFLGLFGETRSEVTAGRFWQDMAERLGPSLEIGEARALEVILSRGTLARRILRRTGENPDRSQLQAVYSDLARCLETDRPLA
jgi:carboxylate-amine ligase